MVKFVVRSYVSVEIEVEADDVDEAIDQAGKMIIDNLSNIAEIDFFEDPIVYDEEGEEIDVA